MRKTWRITQSAICAALGALVLFLGHSLQFGEFFWYLVASALLLVCLVQTGYLGGFLSYVAILVIAYFLTADIFFLIPFAVLGLIPFVELFLKSIHFSKIGTFVIGMIFFDAAIVATFLVFENRLMAFFPEYLESVYPTANHWVLYLGYGIEAFLIGVPSYLAYSFGLAKATLKLRWLLKANARHDEKDRVREQKQNERSEKRRSKHGRRT